MTEAILRKMYPACTLAFYSVQFPSDLWPILQTATRGDRELMGADVASISSICACL